MAALRNRLRGEFTSAHLYRHQSLTACAPCVAGGGSKKVANASAQLLLQPPPNVRGGGEHAQSSQLRLRFCNQLVVYNVRAVAVVVGGYILR
jgi:hypothetical protein